MQLAVAANLAVVAIVLPYVWNRAVDRRVAARAERRAACAAAATASDDAAAERLAIQLLVNERRAARGLPPYPYRPDAAHTDAHLGVFAAAEALHRAARDAERIVDAVHSHLPAPAPSAATAAT